MCPCAVSHFSQRCPKNLSCQLQHHSPQVLALETAVLEHEMAVLVLELAVLVPEVAVFVSRLGVQTFS